jgi:hypothetical protein
MMGRWNEFLGVIGYSSSCFDCDKARAFTGIKFIIGEMFGQH